MRLATYGRFIQPEKNEIKRGEDRMNEKGLLDEIFELALQNDMDYLG